MQSKNPVFARKDAFRTAGYGQPASPDQLQAMYDAPAYQGPTQTGRRMTIDDVVARTAMTLGVLVVVAALAWYAVPLDSPMLFPVFVGAALVGLGLGFFMGLKHVTNPALILTYAAVEGVFIGLASKVIVYFVGGGSTDLVMQAVLGTLGAAAAMLAVYKFEIVRVTPKFTKWLIAATAGFFVVTLLSVVLSFFGLGMGLRGFGMMGLIVSFIGAALASFNLLLDFEYVKQGIQQGAPEKDSWFAAFGLTVTLVWLYIEILRILAILRGD
ncbi:MAG TPA: Bax inhibitor-1/YccA family protein [Actinopolymorphaceae bacterium]